MNRLFLASIAIAAFLAAPAMAADLPVKARPAPPPAAVVAYSWSGFYVGANAGVAWLDKSVTEVTDVPGGGLANDAPFSQSLSQSGFTAGLQVGYNWQARNWVFGVEADVNWIDIDKTVPANKGTIDLDDSLRGKADWFATFRGRIGYAFDRWMPYFTGGAAVARLTNEYGDPDPDDFASVRKTRWGWTIGGGIEAAFAPNWTAKLEYLYLDFDSFLARAIDGTDPDPVEFKDRMHVVRIGLNYRFGAPAAVVARY